METMIDARGYTGRPVWALVVTLAFGGLAWGAEQPQDLNNFQQVSDSLCRGAQPSPDGFRELAKLGVHTVLDLRGAGGRSSTEAKLVHSLGMEYVNIPLDGFKAPTPEEVSKVFAVLNDQNAGKVFVHCRRGADRTGTIFALYRIQHDHWTNQQALSEAKTMKMAAAEWQMQKFVRDYKPVAAPAASTPAAN
jgi:protein tyrosine phosphatase (PTP) superfamily phosphohydrolase (DUF442 family)